VDPSPEWEALGRIYWPVLEYLRASLEIGNDYTFLVPQCYRFPYPEGSAIFAWFLTALGLQNLLLSEPWLFNIILIFSLCLTPFFLRRSNNYKSRFILLGLIIYFFPFVQICLKQFSLNAYSVLFFFAGFLFFRSFLLLRKARFLFPAVIFMALSCAMKHLGVLYAFNLLLVYVIWSFFTGRKFDWRIYLVFFMVFLGGLPFYSHLALNFYPVHQVIHHNRQMGFGLFAATSLLLPLLYCGIVLAGSRFGLSSKNVKLCRGGGLLFFFCLICIAQLLLLPNESAIIPILVLGGILMWFFGYHCRLNSVRSFIYFFIFSSYINMALLFASNVGRVSYVFFLPLLLLLFQTFTETKSLKIILLWLIFFFCLSNFIPSLETVNRIFGIKGRNLYFVIYNSFHNPLGWQSSPVEATRRGFVAEISRRHFSQEPLFLVETFASLLSRQFEIYPGNLLLHTPVVETLSFLSSERKGFNVFQLVQRWRQEGDDSIFKLVAEQKLPILMRPLRPLPSPVDNFRHLQLSNLPPGGLDYLQNPLILAWFFNDHIFNLLEKSGQLVERYEKKLLPETGVPFVEFYILKDLPVSDRDMREPNQRLKQLKKEYEQLYKTHE
jgi:hypothetical protein